jgi:hypothetical protein
VPHSGPRMLGKDNRNSDNSWTRKSLASACTRCRAMARLQVLGAAGDEDDSGEESEEESTPTLLREALAAGFTIDQVRQAEAELEMPSPSTPKVCT